MHNLDLFLTLHSHIALCLQNGLSYYKTFSKFLQWWFNPYLLQEFGSWYEWFILNSYFGGARIILDTTLHKMNGEMLVYIPPPPAYLNENP